MKTIILAGGLGTRLSEETVVKPKPMVEIGGRPMLWHIMHLYAHYGHRQFVVACGYKGEMIQDYFRNFIYRESDVTIDLQSSHVEVHGTRTPNWIVTMLDTGQATQTSGRILRCRDFVGKGTFMATYGDGLASIDINALLSFHRAHGKLATVTAVRPPARFGELEFEGDRVRRFNEKPQTGEGWINGGFFVFEPGVFDYLGGDDVLLERGVLPRLAERGELMAFKHPGFWQPMDTMRERNYLQELWESGHAPWKVWP